MIIVLVVVRENIVQSLVMLVMMPQQTGIGKVPKVLIKEKIKRILQENNHFIEGEIFSILSSLISNSSDSNSVMLGDDCAR